MVDVYVLAHEDARPERLARYLDSLPGQPTNVRE